MLRIIKIPHILRHLEKERVNVMSPNRRLMRHYKLIVLHSRIHEARLRHV